MLLFISGELKKIMQEIHSIRKCPPLSFRSQRSWRRLLRLKRWARPNIFKIQQFHTRFHGRKIGPLLRTCMRNSRSFRLSNSPVHKNLRDYTLHDFNYYHRACHASMCVSDQWDRQLVLRTIRRGPILSSLLDPSRRNEYHEWVKD